MDSYASYLRGRFRSLSWITVATIVLLVATVIIVVIINASAKGDAKMSVSGVGISLTVFICAALVGGLQLFQLRLVNHELRKKLDECVARQR